MDVCESVVASKEQKRISGLEFDEYSAGPLAYSSELYYAINNCAQRTIIST